MLDRSGSAIRSLTLAAVTTLAASSLGAQQQQPTRITLTSDASTAIVDASDAAQVARGVKSVIASQVRGLDVIIDSAGARLRITPAAPRDALGPLFVIDGIPLADGFGLTILTAALERIDLFRDSLSVAPYRQRAANGLVMIATAKRK